MLRSLLCGISTRTNDSAVKAKRRITERRTTVPEQHRCHDSEELSRESEFPQKSKSHCVVANNRSDLTGHVDADFKQSYELEQKVKLRQGVRLLAN